MVKFCAKHMYKNCEMCFVKPWCESTNICKHCSRNDNVDLPCLIMSVTEKGYIEQTLLGISLCPSLLCNVIFILETKNVIVMKNLCLFLMFLQILVLPLRI